MKRYLLSEMGTSKDIAEIYAVKPVINMLNK
jgi:hypothetical protein